MKKLMLILALVMFLAPPTLAGTPEGKQSQGTAGQLRQKLDALKKEKAAALSTHLLEAELMKKQKRGSQSPPTETESRLATRK